MKSVRIRRFSALYFPSFGLNAAKYGPQKLPIRTLFTQCLMYSSISSVFPRGKDLKTNKSSLVDNSQPLTFVTLEFPITTVTPRPFLFLFLFCFYAYVHLFLCHRFCDLFVIICLSWQYSIICYYHYYISFIGITENFISALSYNWVMKYKFFNASLKNIISSMLWNWSNSNRY